jgi:hypothetical protein
MANPPYQIVQINVSQVSAGAPNQLQRTGAFVSVGGTTNAVNSLTLVTSTAALTAMSQPAMAITTITWSSSGGGTATVTLAAASPYVSTDVVRVVILGCSPSGYNQPLSVLATFTDSTHFTYPLTPNPGSIVTPGTAQNASAVEINRMATTYFDQGNANAPYVLELGNGTNSAGVTALDTWIQANPGTVYSFLVGNGIAMDSGYPAMVAGYTALTAKTYFFTKMSSSSYNTFASAKSVFGVVFDPSVTPNSDEFTSAAPFYKTLNYNPSSTNRVTPTAFSIGFGVTPYDGSPTDYTNFLSAGANFFGTGSEGGLSTNVLFKGTTMDKRDFTYWFSVDWVQIHVEQDLANEIIKGSNNPLAPLYYNQPGINRLQGRAASTMGQAITNGLALGNLKLTSLPAAQFAQNFDNGDYDGQVVINAEPFTVYTAENPSDYSTGTYNGFTIVYTPARGFTSIMVGIVVTDFVAA